MTDRQAFTAALARTKKRRMVVDAIKEPANLRDLRLSGEILLEWYREDTEGLLALYDAKVAECDVAAKNADEYRRAAMLNAETWATARAECDRLREALRRTVSILSECDQDYNNPQFTDRHGTGPRIRVVLNIARALLAPKDAAQPEGLQDARD